MNFLFLFANKIALKFLFSMQFYAQNNFTRNFEGDRNEIDDFILNLEKLTDNVF